MCGIFFALTLNDVWDFEKKLAPLMKRRGPNEFNFVDGNSEKTNARFFAAHSRLSITGIKNAYQQPINEESNLFLFNGEIYNYRELIDEFSLGPKDQSDTNVFYKLINKIGIRQTLEKIDGMYAFILFNKDNGILHYGRDHFGQKPLYVFEDSKKLILISEPEYVLAMHDKININDDFINRILQLGYKFRHQTDETEVVGLKTCAPNTLYELDTKTSQLKLTKLENKSKNLPTKTTTDFQTVENSIINICPLEVEYALPISAGIDSNYLLEVFLKNGKPDNFKGLYTVNGTDERYSETRYLNNLKRICRKFGLTHQVIEPPKGLAAFETIKKMTRQRMGLITGLNFVGQFLMFEQMQHDGVKVSISGIGADEMFSGYYDHYNLYYASNPSEAFKKKWVNEVRPIVRNHWLKDIEIFVKDPNFRGHLLENSSQYKELFKWTETLPRIHEDTSISLLRRRMKSELLVEIVPSVLRDDDFNSMYNSIESRAPFLREIVYEYSNRLTDPELFKLGLAKSPLREAGIALNANNPAFSRSHKIGFNLSIWDLISDAKKQFRDFALDSAFTKRYFDIDLLDQKIQSESKDNFFSKLYFGIICSAMLEEV